MLRLLSQAAAPLRRAASASMASAAGAAAAAAPPAAVIPAVRAPEKLFAVVALGAVLPGCWGT
jgi:hypothetical protein